MGEVSLYGAWHVNVEKRPNHPRRPVSFVGNLQVGTSTFCQRACARIGVVLRA
jgi:hypothetical protein